MTTLIATIVLLGVLIFIHELGHYCAARIFGAKVTVFSIGFGTSIYSFIDNNHTKWKIF